jgi:hypothetical protein
MQKKLKKSGYLDVIGQMQDSYKSELYNLGYEILYYSYNDPNDAVHMDILIEYEIFYL